MGALQIILVALIFLSVVGVGIAYIINAESARRKRYAQVIQGHSAFNLKVKGSAREEQDKRRAEIAKKLKETREGDSKAKKKSRAPVSLMIEQAGLKASVKKFWILSFASMIVFTFIAKMMGQPMLVVLFVGVVGLLGFPRYVLKNMAKRRQKKFLHDFADGLEGMIRLIKAGMPISEAIAMVAREFGGPLGEEMSRIYDKQKIGIPLHEAALESTRRMPLPEMRMFATGLAIQAQTGSSLSEVLQNLAGVIRARFKLRRKIKALSSEAIASAGIIGALPNVVASGLYFVNYEYISVLFTTPTGNMLLGIAVGMMVLGCLVMKAMINFKI
ncbi:MAG: type II secretion system F family protein [Alphaproteobacteria bacterium]